MSENLSRILVLIADLNGTAHKTGKPAGPPKDRTLLIEGREKHFYDVTSPVDLLLRELNFRVERYKLFPVFRLRKASLAMTWGQFFDTDEGVYSGADLVLVPLLHDALAAGDLQKLKWCEWSRCNKWFFKRVGDQRFCSSSCREKAFKSTPQFKRERAKYMRELRELHESGKVK